MTKVDRLNTFMTERLMEAVKEILFTVGRTIREYEEETERIRTENERLKEMLRVSGRLPEHTNPALQPHQPVSSGQPSLDEKPETLEKIQQNQWQTESEQQPHIKSEESVYSFDTLPESAASPFKVDDCNKASRLCTSDTNETTDFPPNIKVELINSSLCSGNDIENTEEFWTDPNSCPDFSRSQHPNQPMTNEAPPTLSQKSSLSNEARHFSYNKMLPHQILCTNGSRCNSKCFEMQKRTTAKSSPVWKYFSLKEGDCSKAVCRVCRAVISRGRKEHNTSALLKHLRVKHALQTHQSVSSGQPSLDEKPETNSGSRSQHPNHRTPMTKEAPPTLSQQSSLSNKARHMQKKKIAKMSPVWKYFSLKEGDCSKAVCRVCRAVISRGHKKYSTSSLLKHLRMKHGKC